MIKSGLTFSFQMILIWLIRDEKGFNILMGNIEINLARVICAFILHIMIMPEINCSINLMRFTRNNTSGFYGKASFFPFMVSFMKLTAGLMTEYTCILIVV